MKQIFFRGWLLLAVFLAIHLFDYSESADLSDPLRPLITTSELVVGQNRFAFGLLKSGKLLENADVTLRVYRIDGQEARLAAQSKVIYQPIETAEHTPGVHRHSDGTQHIHDFDSEVRGLYVSQLGFARAGAWGLEIAAQQTSGPLETARFTVNVLDAAATPAVGAAAPRSRNLIARDVKDLHEIDTSAPPDPRLHQVRIADAIAQQTPQLIVFATPQFCTSRMCGPVVDIVRQLLPRFGNRVAFTHQEIWQDYPGKKAFPTVVEWRLQSEPWIFVVDRQGIIRGKFEGLMTLRELEGALQQVVEPWAAREN